MNAGNEWSKRTKYSPRKRVLKDILVQCHKNVLQAVQTLLLMLSNCAKSSFFLQQRTTLEEVGFTLWREEGLPDHDFEQTAVIMGRSGLLHIPVLWQIAFYHSLQWNSRCWRQPGGVSWTNALSDEPSSLQSSTISRLFLICPESWASKTSRSKIYQTWLEW